MPATIIRAGDPKAVKKYSAFLAIDTPKKMYWSRFLGKGEKSSMPFQMLKDLEKDAGDVITYDLTMQMTMQPVEGDETLEGKEDSLRFYSDEVRIDQLAGGINTGGRMTRKRTVHNLRKLARRKQSDWWARVFDEYAFMYASGARGINADFVFPTSYTGFAGNPLTAPDSEHIIYANKKTKATLAATDTMTLTEIDRMVARAEMMGGGAGGGAAGTDGNTQTPQIQPIKVGSEKHYVLVMNPWQAFDLRHSTATGDWLDIQKAVSAAVGTKSPIFTGKLGIHNDVVLHKHRNVIRFNDYGSGENVEAARALFLGEQAIVMAFGSPGTGLRFQWHEETEDRGRKLVITSSTIVGWKKATFNGKDYGIAVIDTAAKDPNA